MGFAAGFAAGYEAVDKGRREEEARKKQIDDEAKKLKEEQDKVFNSAGQEIASHNKLVSDLTINMAKAEDEQQYNAYASELKAANDNFASLKTAKIDNYKDTPLAASLDKLYSNARISNAETVEKTDIKDVNGNIVQAYLPSSMAQDKDNIALMENGKLGIAQVGQDGKIAGYQPTNIAPIKFKTPYEKTDYGIGVEKVVDKSGKIKLVSRKDAIEGTNNGTYTPYERPKDSTVVNVMGEGKPIELADQFGEYYANKDTGEPIKTKDGKIAYKKLNEKTSKTIESIDQSKKTIASLNNMVKILDKNPEAVGSIGENPYEYVANYANDILGIPTKELANRTTIQGASGVLAAMTRKIYENGVMTDEDYQRYKKLIPDANDSEIVFRNKAKILISDLNSQVKKTEERYSKTLPDFVSDKGESAIAPYEEAIAEPKKKSWKDYK
jgi:hypothetical protein